MGSGLVPAPHAGALVPAYRRGRLLGPSHHPEAEAAEATPRPVGEHASSACVPLGLA